MNHLNISDLNSRAITGELYNINMNLVNESTNLLTAHIKTLETYLNHTWTNDEHIDHVHSELEESISILQATVDNLKQLNKS